MSPDAMRFAERYALNEVISRGGMATVWKATDDILARTVAVKVLHEHLAADEAFVERFRREALAAAGLSHPNILAIYDTGSEPVAEGSPESHYIVMEHCARGTLAHVLQSETRLDWERALAAGSSVCDALSYAHAAAVIHRDIKPANVLVTAEENLKVGDFGIAKAAAASGDVTTTGAILGTVSYLSPEQALGKEPDHRSDLYSLGVVLYELLTGRPPFAAETQLATAMAHVHDSPAPPRALSVAIPRPVEAVVMKALEKDPADRYQSADEMRDDLDAAAGRGATKTFVRPRPAASGGKPRPSPRGPGEARSLLPVLALVAAAVLSVLFLPGLLEGGGGRGDASPDDARPLRVAATDFDPHGEGSEHPDEVAHAVDGNAATSWRTETYSTPLGDLKGGVGLLFDMGSSHEVSLVRVASTPGMRMELRYADDEPRDETTTEVAATIAESSDRNSITLDDAIGARYWLLWITSLPDGGAGAGQVSEVVFHGE